MAADAGATAGRQALDPFQYGAQAAPVTKAMYYANLNNSSSVTDAADVVQGWWDVNAKTFGPSIAGQTGNAFNNAVKVTVHHTHNLIFGGLLGVRTLPLQMQSIAYKCSNTDYPLTLIPDDPNPPALPAIWESFAADGNPANTSYYYANPDGHKNPVIKFWVPVDGVDVSFVLFSSDGSMLQVDSYCRGTFLVVPDAFDYTNLSYDIVSNIEAGSTNNSFAVYPDQQNHPLAFHQTTYYHQNTQPISYLADHPDLVRTTPYPSSLGIQYWASTGDPTPDRRAIMVQ